MKTLKSLLLISAFALGSTTMVVGQVDSVSTDIHSPKRTNIATDSIDSQTPEGNNLKQKESPLPEGENQEQTDINIPEGFNEQQNEEIGSSGVSSYSEVEETPAATPENGAAEWRGNGEVEELRLYSGSHDGNNYIKTIEMKTPVRNQDPNSGAVYKPH